MNKDSRATRLAQYIAAMLPGAHGHQHKAIFDFVAALIAERSCCQATLARYFGNFEAALKRCSRLLHNERLKVDELALSHAHMIWTQLPRVGEVRVAIDWTIEDKQHLLVASLIVSRRAIPLYWQPYRESELKDKRSEYEREFVRCVVAEVLTGVARTRLIVTADRGFAAVEMVDVLNDLRVCWVLRVKSSTKVKMSGEWRRLQTLKFRGNHRRRSLGRLAYCQSAPRRVYVTHARARDRTGKWGVWFLISNQHWSAHRTTAEYARRFGCEEGFRDAKRMLGFAQARISALAAWTRMFTLVAIALLVLVGIGCRLVRQVWVKRVLRRVCSRRTARRELSMVRAVTELLKDDKTLWELLDHRAKLNLEACL